MHAERLSAYNVAPLAMKAVLEVENYIQQCGLEKSLIELVKMRASQINGCAYCLDMHSKDARRNGETEQRLYLLDAWRESTLYSARERTALAWTEVVTRQGIGLRLPFEPPGLGPRPRKCMPRM